ncbi:hypothetical protein BG015_001099 [Linnemannia schmuckeri]|uniref:Restriction of telomere capping protein 4 n=1 Tax=Linnemannia schmuckeri TaxID=64567 RepID=A0A9P5V795_9FUNG|nr:hypothetical protein BG015_001099 [Linnemannia schmuckeri]
MHPSSQEQRATHIRFSQDEDEEEGQARDSTASAIEIKNRPTNGTKASPATSPSWLQQQPRPLGPNTRLPPVAPATTKTPAFLVKKPPQKPKSIDVQNHLSAVRRAENPLYTHSPSIAITTATYNYTKGPEAGAATMMGTGRPFSRSSATTARTGPVKIAQQSISNSLGQARTIEQERQSIRSPPLAPGVISSIGQHQKQRHFAIPPKSPRTVPSFGSHSPSPKGEKESVKGKAINVTPLNSTSWLEEDRAQGTRVRDKEWWEEDDEEEGDGDDDEVVQVRIPHFLHPGGSGGVSKDTGSKPTAITTTTKTTATTMTDTIPTKKQVSLTGWIKQDVKDLINSVADKSSKAFVKTKDVMGCVENMAASASSQGHAKKKDEDDDENEDEDGAGWLDESLGEESWSEFFSKDLDFVEKNDACRYSTQEIGQEREKEQEMKQGMERQRQRERDQDRRPLFNKTAQAGKNEREKRRKHAENPELDFPYSDDEKPSVQEKVSMVPAPVNEDTATKDSAIKGAVRKDAVVKGCDHGRDQELEREHERNQKHARGRDGQKNGMSTADTSPREKKSEVEVSRRSSFLPSDISSDGDYLPYRQRQQPSSDRRGSRTSSSGKASQEGMKSEAKACKASSILPVDEELPQSHQQRLLLQTLKLSRKPDSKTPLEDILRNRSSAGQDDRPSTPTRSIYNPKNSNLHRSIDAPDSDSDLDDPLFSIAATQPQSDPPTQSLSSAPSSRPLSQTPSVTSADSFSSTAVKIGGSKRERDFERMPKNSTSFIDLSDSSLEDGDNPFLEHSTSKPKLSTGNNKDKDVPGTLVLKKRKETPRTYIDTCHHQGQQQRDERRRTVQSQRDLDDDSSEESIGRWKQLDSGDHLRPSKPKKADDEIPRYRGTNGPGDTRRPLKSNVRTKTRIVCGGEDDDSENAKYTKSARPVADSRGDASALTREVRQVTSSCENERVRTFGERRTTGRGYSHSHKDDRDRRRDQDRDSDRDQESTNRPKKSSVERSPMMMVRQVQPPDSPFDVLLTPTSSHRKTPKTDHLSSSQKRRSHPASTSDEESDSPPTRPTTPEPPRRTAVMQYLEKPPSTPTKDLNGRKSELDGIKSQGLKSPKKSPRIGDDLKLPSPRRKRIRAIPEMISLSDDDYPSLGAVKEGEDLCPYCGDALPTEKSARLKSSLAKILARQEDRLHAQQELLRRERIKGEHFDDVLGLEAVEVLGPSTATAVAVTTPKKPWVPRPRKLERLRAVPTQIDLTTDASGTGDEAGSAGSAFFAEKENELQQRLFSKITAVEKFEFCRIHVAEEKIIPAGLERNYPLFIRFDELPDRIRRMEPELLGIICGTVASPYLDRALANYRKLGHGARNPQAVLAGVQMTLPGYYGSKGSSKIVEVLVKMFIETQILTNETARPQMPIEYIQQVLVPETGVRLIMEDRQGGGGSGGREGEGVLTVEEAQAIMLDSVEFGNYVHDIELPW